MPTYEYKCDSCGHHFDLFQSMKDAKLTKCPECSENTLKRLIGTGGGLIFKGSGFYLTDYKNKPKESSASSNKSETSKKDETPAATAASKHETKTASDSSPKNTEKKSPKVNSDKEK